MLGLASFVSVSWVCVADAYTNCTQSVPPGQYCQTAGTKPSCPKYCYCIGDSSEPYNATGDDGDHGTPQDFCNYGHDDSWFFNRAGIYRCPDSHPNTSGTGKSSINSCYKSCSGTDLYYHSLTGGLPAGKYLPALSIEKTACPAGKYCAGSQGDMVNSCSDQGITGSCTGNEYSGAGASQCTECTGDGKAVVKDGTLNVNCDVCPPGTYANDGHTACEICEEGYACTGGIKTQCTGNKYSGARASQCTECTGAGEAVVKDNGLNVGCDVCLLGTYANADHTQCDNCPAGHACSNGVDNDLCPPGTCAAYHFHCVNSRGAECKTCSEINSSKPYSIPARTECVKCDNPVDYYENGECQNCPSVPYNHSLYSPVRIDGQSGTAMCGIKLNTSSSNTPSLCSVESLVQWHIVNDAWKLVEEFSVKADMTHYVKDPSPTSPDGSDADADWCGTCPTGKFNIYANRTGESACVACPAGYCTSNTSCLQCKPGYYCPGEDDHANSCETTDDGYGIEKASFICKKGSFSAPGQVSCTKCASGYTTDIDNKPYYPDTDNLNNICQKIKIRLKFNDSQWVDLPDNIFKNVKMNASVLQPQ